MVRVGKSKKNISVRKSAVNELSLCDVFTVARELLVKKDLKVTRYRRKLRADRSQKRKLRLLHEMMANEPSSGRSPLVIEAFERIRNRKRA